MVYEGAVDERRRARGDLILLGALALGLLAFYLAPFIARGFGFPIGPDAPVYLWWTRLAGHDGLSAVGGRPGVPALALVAGGALGASEAAVVAALEVAFGVCAGLAATVLVRTKTEEDRDLAALTGAASASGRPTWLLAGALAGLFAVHLVAGWLANIAFAVAFLAAASALATGTRRGVIAAAGLLGAGGLLHPQFFLAGLAVLWFASIPSLVAGRAQGERLLDSEHGRVSAALAGGAALLVGGLALLLAGPDPLAVDTSKDAFLRRAGLFDALKEAYRGRFLERWPRYVQWASVPLAALGIPRAAGAFLGRLLVAWVVVTAGGVAFGLVTAITPPDRFVTFGYAVPILAALGLVKLWRLLGRWRVPAAIVTGALVLAMFLGSFLPWRRQEPFIDGTEAHQVAVAARVIAGTPAGTPLLFVVDTGDPTVTFFATEAGNAIRALVPPDRIRDVYVFVPPLEEGGEAPTRTALAKRYEEDAVAAIERAGERPLVLQLEAFDLERFGEPVSGIPGVAGAAEPMMVDEGVAVLGATDPLPAGAPRGVLQPSSGGGIVATTFGLLALLAVVGFGWARAAVPRAPDAIALAPVFGVAALVLAAIVAERLGVPLTGRSGPALVSAGAGALGYLALLLAQRRSSA